MIAGLSIESQSTNFKLYANYGIWSVPQYAFRQGTQKLLQKNVAEEFYNSETKKGIGNADAFFDISLPIPFHLGVSGPEIDFPNWMQSNNSEIIC